MEAALPSAKVFTPRILVYRSGTTGNGVFPQMQAGQLQIDAIQQHCGSAALQECSSRSKICKRYPAGRGAFRPIGGGITQRENSSGRQDSSIKKKYGCPRCNVTCSNQGQLRDHMRVHTGERPFRCTFQNCTRSFARNEELTRHKRIHSGQRPYSCQVCGKAFSRKDHLNKHQRTHAKLYSWKDHSSLM